MFNNRLINNLKRLRAFLHEMQLERVHLFVPSLFALGAALFEGLTLSLLAPTMQGLMEKDFAFAANLKGIGKVIQSFSAVFEGRNAAVFAFLISLIFVCAILKNIFSYVSAVLVSKQVRRFAHDMRRIIFDAWMGFQKTYFDTQSSGHLQTIMVGYTEQIALQFRMFHQGIYCFFSLIVYFVMMCFISWKMTLFVVLIFPFFLFIFNGLINRVRKDSEHFSEFYNSLGKKIANSLSCIALVKSSCAEQREKEWFRHASERVEASQYKMDKRTSAIGPLQDVFLLGLLIILVSFTAYLIVTHKEGVLSSYLVFFVLIRRALASIGNFTSIGGSLATAMGPLREVMQVVESGKVWREKTGVVPFLKFKEKIEFRDLTFKYGERTILKNLSFEIAKGERVAIVGAAGSGKSTIANLLMRFSEPPEGAIFIDGQEIRHYQLAALRRRIAVVSQDPYFFDAAVDFNLTYGLGREVSEDELEQVLQVVQLGDLDTRLPQGLKTLMGERGSQLSAGERQRLGFARAILRNPDILVLDEISVGKEGSADVVGEKVVAEMIRGRTAIFIASHADSVQSADKIVSL